MLQQLIVRTFSVPAYGSKVIVLLFKDTKESRDALQRYLKRKGFTPTVEPTDRGFQFSQTLRYNKHRFVLALCVNDNPFEIGPHEIYHLTQEILEYHDVEYRRGSSNEAYAYLTGILSNKILPLLLQHAHKLPTNRKQKHTTQSPGIHVSVQQSGRNDRTPEPLSGIQEPSDEKTSNSEIQHRSDTDR